MLLRSFEGLIKPYESHDQQVNLQDNHANWII